jgi:hypothetical protein
VPLFLGSLDCASRSCVPAVSPREKVLKIFVLVARSCRDSLRLFVSASRTADLVLYSVLQLPSSAYGLIFLFVFPAG